MEYVDYENNLQHEEINDEWIQNKLDFIKRGYMPDYNYRKVSDENGEFMSAPDENYPLHVAMLIAKEAVEKIQEYEPGFLENMEYKYGERSRM